MDDTDVDMEDEYEYDEEDKDVEQHNKYYDSKPTVETDPEGALAGFAEVIRMYPADDKWCFKARKQTVKIYCRQHRYDQMMEAYGELLKLAYSKYEYRMRSLVDFVSSSVSQKSDLLQQFYEATVEALGKSKYRASLWFQTNLKLCNILFDRREYSQISKILKELHKSCQKKDGTDDQDKGSQLLEVYAYQFQVYTETEDNENHKMQQLYQKALAITFDKYDPRIVGLIRECGGKMHMEEHEWEEAANDFLVAFKYYDKAANDFPVAIRNYDKADNQRCIRNLKYLVLANMQTGQQVNPFDNSPSQNNPVEVLLARARCRYQNDPENLAMINLIEAYQEKEFAEFEMILESNRSTIMGDPFIRTYMEDILENVRRQVLLNLVEKKKPYTKIEIQTISEEMGVPEEEVKELLAFLIGLGRIDGLIDDVNGCLLGR